MWSKKANIAESFPRLPPPLSKPPPPPVLLRELIKLICFLLWSLIYYETKQYKNIKKKSLNVSQKKDN